MKLVAVLLCTFVAGALGGVLGPVVKSSSGVAGSAALDLGKVGNGQMKSADQERGTKHLANAAQQWGRHDVKKTSVDQDYEKQGNQASHDAKSAKQAHGNAASGWSNAADAANRAASRAGATTNEKAAKDKWAANNAFETQQAWAGNDGFKKNNKKHEGISYSFDKTFRVNDNENGGYNAGHNLANRAVDDVGHSRSSYDKVGGDHAAKTGHAQSQSADRNSGWGDGSWKNARSADSHGRDRSQAAGGHGNDRDWAEKKDSAQNINKYNRNENAKAADVLNNQYLLDRNAGRDTLGYGAAQQGLYGKNAGVVSPVGYGYGHPNAKAYGNLGVKGLNSAKGVSDRSNLWDSANAQKNQDWLAYGQDDSQKLGNVANKQEEDALKGWNQAQNGWHYDKGFAQDAAGGDQGARAANQQWADAGSARAGHQGRHDSDEVIKKKANNQWNKSDRKHNVNEYKKFFSNDKKGGQNWERLKYNKDQTEDAGAADFANKNDNANRWQSSHRFDDKKQAAHSADSARAQDAADKHWSKDAAKAAHAAQAQAASAQDGADGKWWGATNDNRKYEVDQSLDDDKNSAHAQQDRARQWQEYDHRAAAKGASNAVGAKGSPGYGAPYGGAYGNAGLGGYGNNVAGYGKGGFGGYGNNVAGYGKGFGGYGNNVAGYGKGFGGYGNNVVGYGKGFGGYGNNVAGYGNNVAGYGKGFGGYGNNLGAYGKGGYGNNFGSYGNNFGKGYGAFPNAY